MRKLTILYTLVLLNAIAHAQNGEEANIKKAILAAADANQNRNLEAFATTWQHDPQTSFTFFGKNGYNMIKSWDSLRAMVERNFKQNPKPDNTTAFDNFSIRNDGNLATADYDLLVTPVSDQSSIFPYEGGAVKLHVHDVLVKENGQWKTNSRIVTSPQSYDANTHAAEIDLNTAGYDLLFAKKVKEAIEVFKLNVKLHPESWNVYDSLGEAYAAAGDKKNAIANYEKSIELNPKSQGGKEALAKLKQK
jgi:tetratricopeptide (TPR) repeat protein